MTEPDWTKNHARPNVAAGVLFTDEEGRILMVEPTYKDYLDIPGGYVETGETPFEAVQREVFEELGIKPPIGRLLVVDWRSSSPEVDLGSKLLLIFDGHMLSQSQVDAARLDLDEIRAIRPCPLDRIAEMTIPRLATRLGFALQARSSDQVFYLENGVQV